MGDGTTPVDQDPDLSAGFMGECRQLTGELLGQQSFGRQASLGQALELPNLTGLESVGVPGDPDWIVPRFRVRAPRVGIVNQVAIADKGTVPGPGVARIPRGSTLFSRFFFAADRQLSCVVIVPVRVAEEESP